MYPLIPLKFTDVSLKTKLIDFVTLNYLNTKYFSANGKTRKRFFCNILQHDLDFVDQVKALRLQSFTDININSFKEEPMYGIFLGVNLEEGFVHQHQDLAPENFVHTRINFLLSKPIQGGQPIINNKVYNVDEDCSWINLASKWLHSSSPVIGNKPRIVLSMGSFVETSIIDSLNIRL